MSKDMSKDMSKETVTYINKKKFKNIFIGAPIVPLS